MEKFDKGDKDSAYSYGSPSVSAWIAAAAVAFAFFMVGGFIKTYRQLEVLKEEHRRETAELRLMVEELHAALQAGGGVRKPPAQAATPANGRGLTRLADEARRQGGRPGPAAPNLLPAEPSPKRERVLIPEVDSEQTKLTYSIGRSAAVPADRAVDAGLQPGFSSLGVSRNNLQVVAVNREQKRIMVEGGANLDFAEGSRLELSRNGRWIGDLRILEVFSYLSACEVLHATYPPQPGDIVRMPDAVQR